MPANGDAASMHSISDYYSAVQLRFDRWSALREVTDTLADAGARGRGVARHVRKAEGLLEALYPIEVYWAFPGLAAFDQLRRHLEHRNSDDLAFSVRRVVRALTSGAYRRRHITLARDERRHRRGRGRLDGADRGAQPGAALFRAAGRRQR